MTNRVQSGQRLGKYQLIKQLGAGGFAEVFLAEHSYLKQRVAIKVLTIPLDQKESEKFLLEAQTMARLKHPHIVGCSDFDIEQGIPFLVMEYVPGGTLRDRYPDGSLVPLPEVINYVDQVAEALQYAHDQGVMHLDIKPENMLLSTDGTVKLSDFGLARFTHSVSKSKKLTSLIGTVGYMAPEFIQSTPQAATDQYALAMVAYEWLSGTLPFGGSDERAVALQHMSTPAPSLRHYSPSVPVAVDEVIYAALAKQPEDRYPSIGEFAETLAHASTIPDDDDVKYDLAPEPPETLYKEGLRARGQGKLELAEQLLSQLQSRAPAYHTDIVQGQLQQIRTERRPHLLKQYRAEADAANETGVWAQEIDALQHLLQLGPQRPEAQQARNRIRLAQQHQQYDYLYQQAEEMIQEGNKEGARLILQDLWEKDSYYGDPAGLARKAKKVTAPRTYQQEQVQIQRERTRQEREDEASYHSAERDEFREKAYGPQLHRQWLVCCSWFLLLTGVGAMVGALTQSWLLSLAACAITGIGGWFLGYRKALDPIPLSITSILSLASTLALTLILARLNYAHPISVPYTVSISTGFFTSKEVTQYQLFFLGRQLNFGLICGVITALIAIITGVIMRPPWGKKEEYTVLYAHRSIRKTPEPEHLTISQLIGIFLGIWIAGAALAAIIASFADTSWGFGWNVGANMMLVGFLIGSVLGAGLGTSLPIWWTALKK
jgi:serine/threonine protein kinase